MPEEASSGEHWLIYALGGGWGHLSRSVALGRAASQGRRATVVSNSPYAGFVLSRQPGCPVAALPAAWSIERVREAVSGMLSSGSYSRLVVDTFPRGLGGELAPLLPRISVPRVLVVRDLSPRYVSQYELRKFVADHYDLAICPHDACPAELSDLPIAAHTPPWLLRDFDELPDAERARGLLRASDGARSVVAVCATGTRDEAAWFGQVAGMLDAALPEATVRCIAAERPDACAEALWAPHWPALECWPAAHAVVGGGGYHLIHECAATGAYCIVKPWLRRYDRQRRRAAKAFAIVETPEEALAAVRRALAEPRVEQTRYRNGVHEAVRLIERLGLGSNY